MNLAGAATLACATAVVGIITVEVLSCGQSSVNDTTSLNAARWGTRVHVLNLLTEFKEELGDSGFQFYQRQFRSEVGYVRTVAQVNELYAQFRKE
ncbi:UNVERIFIED_CONTAM: hypothetical protein KB579_05000 [Streptococcus canis]